MQARNSLAKCGDQWRISNIVANPPRMKSVLPAARIENSSILYVVDFSQLSRAALLLRRDVDYSNF